MTIPEIIEAVSSVVGSYSEPTFYRDVRKLNIKAQGFRQRPQNYSPNVVNTILLARGRGDVAITVNAPLDTAAARVAKLPSMAQLRTVRKKARAK